MHDGNLANLGANSASQIGLGTLRVYFDGINTKSTTFFFSLSFGLRQRGRGWDKCVYGDTTNASYVIIAISRVFP